MDISVIVPIYNVENYIERCLRSLFEQTKTEGVEFILVNDATPDRSMAIARRVIAEYPLLTVRIFEHTENRNNGAARQTGMEAAVGDYTIQIDSDDWCEPRMLEDMYAKAIETDADIVCSNSFGNTLYVSDDKNELIGLTIHITYGFLVNATLWNKLVRRSLFVDNNIMIDVGLPIGEDRLTVIKLYYFANKIAFLPEAYYHYTTDNPSSLTNNSIKFSFSLYVKFITLIEEFMRYNSCSVFDYDILGLKVDNKLVWIRDNTGLRQRECISYFPEADNFILKSTNIPMTTKLPYFLIIKGFAPLGNLTTWLIKYGVRIKHSLERSVALFRSK